LPFDDDVIVVFFAKEPEDHENSQNRLILSAERRKALLHPSESWFTEAGANCNAVCARFEDPPPNLSSRSCNDRS
jgi:hypothetical protein